MNEMISTAPIAVEKTLRGDEIRALTSCRAGKIVPVAFAPLLREDSVRRGEVRIKFDMAETIHPLMNAVNVTAYAHVIPFSAFERFSGMDDFNRSYQGAAAPGGGASPAFFQTMNFYRDAPIWKTLGVHWKEGQPINSAVVEAYNTLVNFRRKARSDKLPLRGLLDTSLAEAFWKSPMLNYIVPDFEQAMLDGEVPLTFADDNVKIRGLYYESGTAAASTKNTWPVNDPHTAGGLASRVVRPVYAKSKDGTVAGQLEEVIGELQAGGVTVSLANIELAKQTVAFAKLREKYSGLDDDHIIDLLMQGIRVPDEANRQPQLLDRASTIFGYSERHAMDWGSLDRSVTTGETALDLRFRLPPLNTGGILLITVEIVPEQLHERMLDRFLEIADPKYLPDFLRDYLDPEKVEIVPNRFVDVEHSLPAGTFGYAPLNYAWKRSFTRIGGRYYRRNPDTFVEDRQRFWAVEQKDPSLTTDFYLVRDLPHSVFLDTVSDPFEVLTIGGISIMGNTVFGKVLTEDDGHYEAVRDVVDTSRIDQE